MSKTKAQIQTELRSLRAKLAKAEKLAIERLNRLNDMQMDFNAAEDARHEAIKQRDAALQDRNAAQKHVAKLEETVADRNGKITRLHAERDAAIKERDEALASESKAEAEWAETRQELEVVRARLIGAETGVNSLLAKRDELENQLAAKGEFIDRMQRAERDAALKERDEARKAENELRYWKSQHNEVMGKLGAVSQRIDELTAQRDEYAAKLVEKGAAVSFLEGQLAATEKSRDWWKGEHNKEFDKRLEAEAKLKATNLILAGSDAELKSARDLLDARDVRARSAESRADYWETSCREAMRPWWRRTLDGLCSFTSEGGRK